jgi:hypothetical protein
MSFTITCDADKARSALQHFFLQSLPVGHDKERIGSDAYSLDNEQAVLWLKLVLCDGHFISWQFVTGLKDEYHICLRS